MKIRERNYLLIKKIERQSKGQCPSFPFFGAKYPDAQCIEGYLWDLDKCDENGLLYSNDDNIPCPFCNTRAFVYYECPEKNEVFGVIKRIEFTKKKYA